MNSDRIAVVDDDLYLSGIVKEYDDFKSFFNDRTQDPDDFLTISELEERLNRCIQNTSENLRNAVSQWIREMDSREINQSKKSERLEKKVNLQANKPSSRNIISIPGPRQRTLLPQDR